MEEKKTRETEATIYANEYAEVCYTKDANPIDYEMRFTPFKDGFLKAIEILSPPSEEGETCKDCEVLPGRCAICEGRDKPTLQSNSGETTVSDDEKVKDVLRRRASLYTTKDGALRLYSEDSIIAIMTKYVSEFVTTKRESERAVKSPKVGDYIKGSWRDNATGKTYYGEGHVKEFPAGLFVQKDDEGITPLRDFFHFSEIINQDK